MICPACNRQLEPMTVGDIEVDVCKGGCGGIWFDNQELKKVDEQHEAAGEALLNIEKDNSVVVDHSRTFMCPRCENQKMVKHFVCIKNEIQIDECYACGGIWLDPGELGQIRNQYATEEERSNAARAFFAGKIKTDFAEMRAESEEFRQKAEMFTNAVRYICPSNYIPGDQKWGAF
ncbi:MAG: zf-TFIIB domain-containing protein [Phycisphaerae bacterium]|nr:zf-TFIIB domain-containing protein [Phycisphaerae bacterium]